MGKIIWLEVRRKVFHIIVGTAIALLLNFEVVQPIHLAMLLLVMVFTFTLYMHIKMPVLHEMVVSMEREEVMRKFPGRGAIFFVLGAALAAWIFPLDVAVASILILAWGDGLSAIIGPHGSFKYINERKNWEGLIAGAIFAGAFAAFFVPVLYAFAAAVTAMLIEGLDLQIFKWKIDDNLLVPLVAGAVMVGLGMV